MLPRFPRKCLVIWPAITNIYTNIQIYIYIYEIRAFIILTNR